MVSPRRAGPGAGRERARARHRTRGHWSVIASRPSPEECLAVRGVMRTGPQPAFIQSTPAQAGLTSSLTADRHGSRANCDSPSPGQAGARCPGSSRSRWPVAIRRVEARAAHLDCAYRGMAVIWYLRDSGPVRSSVPCSGERFRAMAEDRLKFRATGATSSWASPRSGRHGDRLPRVQGRAGGPRPGAEPEPSWPRLGVGRAVPGPMRPALRVGASRQSAGRLDLRLHGGHRAADPRRPRRPAARGHPGRGRVRRPGDHDDEPA